MKKISDEIREWCNLPQAFSIPCDELHELADRIDREMVELPRDKDGREVPLDTKELYDANGKKVNITSFAFFCDAYGYWSYWKAHTPDTRCDDGMFYVDGLHLTPPDSFERIADDIEAAEDWCDKNGEYETGITSVEESTLREWADRIRKLAKEDSNGKGQD